MADDAADEPDDGTVQEPEEHDPEGIEESEAGDGDDEPPAIRRPTRDGSEPPICFGEFVGQKYR